MSKLVGVTCSIATQLLLDGYPALNTSGIIAPYEKEICDPRRELLEREGITMVESPCKRWPVERIANNDP